MVPTVTARWVLTGTSGLESLSYETEAAIPALGVEDVLVELYAASINYRELVITRGASGPVTPNIIPSSDGAGVVLSVGSSVSAFTPGDKVVTHLAPFISSDEWPTFANITSGLGQQVNGTLCEYGVFPQTAVIHMPVTSTFEQAATLTCSALTAWNCLFGLRGQELKSGDWILTQGTGGVSIAALQFAVAQGATVIATTSSDEKAKRLLQLGAKHVINYRKTPEWAEAAKDLTPAKRGLDFVVDVVGETTLRQSIKAARVNGLVLATGILGGSAANHCSLIDTLLSLCVVRGVLLATRKMFSDMNSFIDDRGIRFAVDDEIFNLEDAKKAYEKLEAQKHFAKVIIKIR